MVLENNSDTHSIPSFVELNAIIDLGLEREHFRYSVLRHTVRSILVVLAAFVSREADRSSSIASIALDVPATFQPAKWQFTVMILLPYIYFLISIFLSISWIRDDTYIKNHCCPNVQI